MTRGTVQSVVPGAFVAVSWSAETFDEGGMFDLGAQPTRATIPAGGDGLFAVSTSVVFNNVAATVNGVLIFKNGVNYRVLDNDTTTATNYGVAGGTLYDRAVAGDYYEVRVFHNHGVARDINPTPAGDWKMGFQIARISA